MVKPKSNMDILANQNIQTSKSVKDEFFPGVFI